MLEHLGFLYISLCYAIGLPSLAVAVIVYLKTRQETIKRVIPLLAAITLQLILSAVLQYREANMAGSPLSFYLLLLYAYFISESATIFVLPYLAHRLARINGGKRDRFFLMLFMAMAVMIFTPFFLAHPAQPGRVQSGPGLYLYRVVLALVVVYAVLLVLRNYQKLGSWRIRVLFWLALAFFGFFLLQMLQCQLMPLARIRLRMVPLAPACYFLWNLAFLFIISRRFLLQRGRGGVNVERQCASYGLTAREREVAGLMLAGLSNREIGKRLYVSEATVKTHILNIYRKLAVKNRVQFMNKLAPPGA